jgi:diguanylate cyclase (GGDEF)-like protein/PAS domain S-box-containing protein
MTDYIYKTFLQLDKHLELTNRYGFLRTRLLMWLVLYVVVELQTPVMASPFGSDTVKLSYLELGTPILLLFGLLIAYFIHSKAILVKSLRQAQSISRELNRTNDKLAHMIATSPTILFALKFNGDTLIVSWISDNITRITGYSMEEALHSAWWEKYLHDDDRDRVLQESKVLFSGQHFTYEHRFMHRDGSVLWIRDEQQLICDELGQPIEILAAWTDITTQKAEEINLRIAATAFETNDAIMITDKDNCIIRVNRSFTKQTGYDIEDVIGKTPAILKSGRHEQEFYQQMWRDLQTHHHWEGEIWNRRKNGQVYPEWLTISAVVDEKKNITHFVGTFFDISDRKETEEYIRHLAYYDSLTGLPNRRLIQDRLVVALTNSQRSKNHGALMFMDLDRFKILNDTQGHDVGDQLLIEVASRLQACIRAGDTVARLGGDEFVVMLENLSKEQQEAGVQALAVAEKIATHLAATYWLVVGYTEEDKIFLEHHSSASIGLVLFLGHETTHEDLLKRADMAMYQAKHAGRNVIRVFDPTMQLALNNRAAMESDLRQALSYQEFTLNYQVQVDITGRAVGAEALLRWFHPLRGAISPAEFIPLAEETGLILNIGHWVLQQGCATIANWANQPKTQNLKLAVNVSARQFRQHDFVEQVQHAIQESGANPHMLKLEITESLVMDNIDDTIAKMHKIKALGVGFSMDDFGTGYSSLSYLQRMPLDQLKIDQAFVRDLSEDTQDAAIVRIILSLGHSLGLTVIAEGVETAVQRDYLAAHGCKVFQGYFFSKPMPLHDFEQKLLEFEQLD